MNGEIDMKIAIHQPEFLPWTGYFNKMSKVDTFVFLDNVQYEQSNFQSRNKIIGSNTGQYIRIPIQRRGFMNKSLSEIKIVDESLLRWRNKFLHTIKYNYCKHPYFERYYNFMEGLVWSDITSLCEFNIKSICFFASELGLFPKFIRASQLSVEGKKSMLILHICKEVGADVYVSGMGAKNYLTTQLFNENGIKVEFNDYKPCQYLQLKTKEFIPNLSTLDLLMNVGPQKAREVIFYK